MTVQSVRVVHRVHTVVHRTTGAVRIVALRGGPPGPPGVPGTGGPGESENGWSPVFAMASDGARRVLQIADWVGGEGSKPATGSYVGVSGFVASIGDAVDVRGAQGAPGADGDDGADGAPGTPGTPGVDGDNGWSPVFAVVSDGARRVLQIADWVGGEGSKPATGSYVGGVGFVAAAGDAVDVRGPAGAGSKTLGWFTARDNNPPASNFATVDTRNGLLVLDFDDGSDPTSADERAIFNGVMPEGAVLTSGVVVNIRFMATTATTGNVRLRIAMERTGTDLDTDSFDTHAEVTAACSSVNGEEATASITITTIDGIAPGDRYRLALTRVESNAADTMLGDAEFTSLEVRSAA